MNIAVIGTGYVGLVTGTCFAELGNQVTCIDIDKNKIKNLKKGILPIFESGLEDMVLRNQKQHRLEFITSLNDLSFDPDIIFIAVGTPSDEDGSADLQYVLRAAADVGRYIKQYCVVVDKSTVPVGTATQVVAVIQKELEARNKDISFDVVSNPEFLREGMAIRDFMYPDRIIIGCDSKKARCVLENLYNPIARHSEHLLFMHLKDAEMTKYVANAMLATRISFMNEISLLCDRLGVDVENVRQGIGTDERIGNQFINPGCGYGGSCFPKDVKALIKMAEACGIDPLVLRAIEDRNYLQKRFLSQKIISILGEDLSHITFGIWGLAFKPGTDDMREAPSAVIIEELLARGASIQAYDPEAMVVAKSTFPAKWFKSKKLNLLDQQSDVLVGADALILITEWKSFCNPDVSLMHSLMRRPLIFDGRNQYDPARMKEAGFEYYGVGR